MRPQPIIIGIAATLYACGCNAPASKSAESPSVEPEPMTAATAAVGDAPSTATTADGGALAPGAEPTAEPTAAPAETPTNPPTHDRPAGRLEPEVIRRVIQAKRGSFRSCYEAGLMKDPSLGGKVSIRFVISKQGAVTQVNATGDMRDEGVTQCIATEFGKLTFPKPEGGVVNVTYPLIFRSSDTSTP